MQIGFAVMASFVLLSGCASLGEALYDEQARKQCEEIIDPVARAACIDGAEQQRRDRPAPGR